MNSSWEGQRFRLNVPEKLFPTVTSVLLFSFGGQAAVSGRADPEMSSFVKIQRGAACVTADSLFKAAEYPCKIFGKPERCEQRFSRN